MPHEANQGASRAQEPRAPSSYGSCYGHVRRRPPGSVRSLQTNRNDSDNDFGSDGTHVPLRNIKRKRRNHKYAGTTADEIMRGFRHKAGKLLSTCGSSSSTPSDDSDTTHIKEEIHVSKDLQHIVTVTSYNSPREGKYTAIKVKPLEAGARIHQRQSRFLRDDTDIHARKSKRRKSKSKLKAPSETASTRKLSE